jgi:hypothetical protein
MMSAADFKPFLEQRLLHVYLQFPVDNFELVLREIEERRLMHHAALDPVEEVKAALEGIGDIQEEFTYGDYSYRIELSEGHTEQEVLDACEKASRKFWHKHNLARTPEVKALLTPKQSVL